MTLTLSRYRLEFRLRDDLALPRYAGSMWRGSLGWSLRTSVCVQPPGTDCGACALRNRCLYALCYEAVTPGTGHRLDKMQDPPRPFVLEPLQQNQILAAGATLVVDLVLPGRANDWLLPFVASLERAGRRGFGPRHARAELTRVLQQDAGDLGRWRPILDARGPDAPRVPPVPPCPERVRVEILTQIRLKQEGAAAVAGRLGYIAPDGFRFSLLDAGLDRRLRLLERLYGGVAPEEQQPTAHSPEQDPVIGSNIRWQEWQRVNQQGRRVQLGGLMGTLDLAGELLAPSWPRLWFGQWTHVGQGTTFGLGGYRLVAADGPG